MSLNTGFFKDSKDLIHLFYIKEQTGLAILVWAILQMLYKPNFWITQNYQNLLACARANVAGGVSETGLSAPVPAAGLGTADANPQRICRRARQRACPDPVLPGASAQGFELFQQLNIYQRGHFHMCENEIPLDTNNIIRHAKRIIPLSPQD